jgi:hypothetical protein
VSLAAVTALTQQFESAARPGRLRADVAELARSPRNRHDPASLSRARAYVTSQLTTAGWRVTPEPFERRWVVGVSGAGGSTSLIRRLRLFRRVAGVNLLAELPAVASRRRVLLIAHLDTVTNSPGADDNASGVAALLECARLLASLPDPPAVALAVVDLEELGKVGSCALARDPAYVHDLDAVLCLESVGTFIDAPGSQRLGGLGLLFRDVARHARAHQYRGDFALALCRTSTLSLARTLATAGQALSTPLPILLARDPRPDGRRGRWATLGFPLLAHLDRSDHAPFWHRGVPALMLTTTAPFRNRHYHRAGDRPETLDYPRLTTLTIAVAAAVATRPSLNR